MPRSFAFNDIAGVGDVYLPASLMRAVANGPAPSYLPWIKLRPHVTVAAANAALEPIVREILKIHSVASLACHLGLQPIIVPYQQNLGRTLALLLAGVVLLLIIGCANCSILLLARGRTRQHELAIRTAIGASRWRIVRQLLVEALVISCAGAVLGVAASYWLARLPLLLSPDSFPAESVIRINASVLAFSVALALLCGILFGLAPALRLSRHDPARMLPGPAGWRGRCSCKASLERSHRGAGRAHASSYGHCGNRHPQLSPAHADAARLRSRKCHEARHRSCTSTTRPRGAAFSRAKRAPPTSSRSGRRSHPSPVSPRSLSARMPRRPVLTFRARSTSTEVAIASSRRPV